MDYPHEDFIPWYRRATPGWLALSAEARGVLVSVCMNLNHRTGAVVLRRGLPSLALLVAIPWETLEPAIGELVAAEKLQWDGSTFTLSDPDFRKRMRMDLSTERVRAFRAKRSETDETRETEETRGNGETVNRSDQIRSEDPPLSPPHGGGADGVSEGRTARNRRGTRLSSDWAPSEELQAWARANGIADPLAPLAEFRDYWAGVAGAKGVKLDWEATYRNRLRQVAQRAKGRPEPGSPTPLTAEESKARAARAAELVFGRKVG